jgi:hypothetical protein
MEDDISALLRREEVASDARIRVEAAVLATTSFALPQDWHFNVLSSTGQQL